MVLSDPICISTASPSEFAGGRVDNFDIVQKVSFVDRDQRNGGWLNIDASPAISASHEVFENFSPS